MSNITKISRDKLVEAIIKELDTRDKRFMFLKCMFPHVPSLVGRIDLEGSSYSSAWEIYFEFDKQGMVGSLMACMNNVFNSNLDLIIDGKERNS
jgi:hypothetical protein